MITKEQQTFFKEWISDLRSGKYKQGQKYLCNNNEEYCCLGVACQTAYRLGIIDEKQLNLDFEVNDYPSDEWFSDASGLRTSQNIKTNIGNYCLAELNDVQRWDFNKIADALEEFAGLKGLQ